MDAIKEIDRLAAEAAAWKSRARAAANSIDALLLYATRYPTDSHALDAYALLVQIRADLRKADGIAPRNPEPRTVDTFGRTAAGRSIIPPLSPFPTAKDD